MIRQAGSTNGFFFSESLIGGGYNDLSKIAIVPTPSGSSYAVPKRSGRRVADQRNAFGFWRFKAYRNPS